ncbi:la-related protein 1C-like isoform X2 [Impatiens glandulifera]|uniref:la-related protein 1C-like isoform X2 n=1 Tax=Impatiens glandulifera TaxID=253017 RepID=UPI001FB19204|nr:la-related protein 1C-like isoform X2 [Impatiens glandulifera]
METATKSATISHLPQISSDGFFLTGDQSKDSTAAARIVSSPWTQMVRGSESDPLCPLSSDSSHSMEALSDRSSDIRSGGNKADKKPAWNKPLSSGAVEDGPVMDAVSWPALSESTKTLSKSGSSDSLKAVSDGLVPKFQIVTDNANAISSPVIDNDSFVQPQQGLVVEVSPNAGKLGSPVVEASFSKESTQKESSGQRVGVGSQSHGEQQQQHRGSFRRSNGGLNHHHHHRSDGGSYHHNHAGRRDQERGNRDWNRNRSFNGRDSRGYVRAPPPPPPPHDAPFIPPPQGPLRPPYGNHPMVYQAPVVYPMGPPLMFFPAPDPMLHSKIVNQIDYYFSSDNLVKDTFLRQNMDEQGWVPINLIANFKKVRILMESINININININYNIQLILSVLRSSSVVEVQGDKVRKRDDWWKWTMQQASVQLPAGGFSHDNMHNFRQEEKKMTESMAELMNVRTSVLNRGF